MYLIISCRATSKDGATVHTMDTLKVSRKAKTLQNFNTILDKVAETHPDLEKGTFIILFMKYFKK